MYASTKAPHPLPLRWRHAPRVILMTSFMSHDQTQLANIKMATYLAVPLKRTWEIDTTKPLRTFISDTYGNANPDDYNKALQEFSKLRNNMIAKSVDKHESALEVLYRYYDQLVAIEGKLPIAENQIRINFKWQDAFDKESFFSGKRTLVVASGAYEKVCLLFNIAALQSQIAEIQNPESDEGLKQAAKLFGASSGIFSYLKDVVLSHVQNEPTPDMHPDTLGALSSLMLAQSQDTFCRKAITGKMKPAIVAKLCHQASDLYAEAMKQLQLQTIRDLWPRDWISSVAGKQAAYHALAEYYQSMVAKENKEFGEEIARLKHAKDLMVAAETRAGGTFIFVEHNGRIQRALKEAEKDNEFIYHARVPDTKTLPSVGKAAVAKATELKSPLSQNFTDLFEKVVPLAVHQALVGFDARRSEIVNMEIGRLREATQLLNGVMSSMNLPAAIEDLSGSKIPTSLTEKASKLREMGGAQHINKLMTDLPELLTRNRELLDEAVRMLDEEETSDKQLRSQFKERWTRTPSEKLTESIRAEGTKYRSIIDNAIRADSIVRERYEQHRSGIELLSQPDSEIERALPSGSPVAALQGSPIVAELKDLCTKAETLKAERDAIEMEVKDAKCDMTTKFMGALAADGALNDETLSNTELDRIYSPLREQVTDSIHRQESVLANIQRANDQFMAAKSQTGAGASREDKLKSLAAAFDSFAELKNNLEEGTKFYNDLTQLLVKFQGKVSDLCFARKTEKEELMKDLQTSIANQPSTAPPSTPSYQQPTESSTQDQGQGSRVPPPRPPPPTIPTRPAPQAPHSVQSSQPASAPPPPHQPYGQAPYPAYGQATPYPVQPPMPYSPPPMPQGYNPYAQYSYPGAGQQQQPQAYPTQYPGYPQPGYPQQQWR